ENHDWHRHGQSWWRHFAEINLALDHTRFSARGLLGPEFCARTSSFCSARHWLYRGRPLQTRFAHDLFASGRSRHRCHSQRVHDSMTNFILATAGHVDHGKSALVKALTGTDPDRLPEEKARGITIDLGFAHLELAAPPSTFNGKHSTFSVGLVDVPGRQDFVRNMIAGVGAIDLALFAVAANEGWMPQTE